MRSREIVFAPFLLSKVLPTFRRSNASLIDGPYVYYINTQTAITKQVNQKQISKTQTNITKQTSRKQIRVLHFYSLTVG